MRPVLTFKDLPQLSWTRRVILAIFTGVFVGVTPAWSQPQQQTAKPLTIMVFGDSLSAEYGLKRGSGWVSLLQDRLKRSGFPHVVNNASISGETTAGGLSRLPATLKRVKPDLVILELGGNDGLRGLPVGTTKKNLTQMIQLSKESGATPLLVGIRVPPNYGPHYARQFDGLFKEVAQATGTPLVPFLLEGIAENPAMFLTDGIHPNEPAQARLLDNVWPTLIRMLPSPAAALDFSDIAREGQLRFLTANPDPGSYSYDSRVSISEESFDTGVVSLQTCHRKLDPIRKIVIAFNPKRLMALEIASAEGMGTVEIKGHHVEMTNVTRGASICINLQSKALDRIDEQTYRLQAGPLMRRYLDGYLPMQANLRFEWPKDSLRLKSTNPAPQPGVRLHSEDSNAELDMVFAGRLLANIDLVRSAP